ncbi:lipase family protein [Silvanigrella aquatica]|uniref:Fungal lipase-type domain-containing protein n=1 Tax=Silvanigrella aquatica TaxID=1915309 RepID=A0A1L4D1S3_9BACT|nr:hypothetical protein [Silvanigrella aquatica]APJ04140.1 hypothetical protein AXG55_09580 [Silvanigrella aquatica]
MNKKILTLLYIYIIIFQNKSFPNENKNIYCSKIDGTDLVSSWIYDPISRTNQTTNGEFITTKNNGMIFKSNRNIAQLKLSCSKIFNNADPKQIQVTIKENTNGQQFYLFNVSQNENLTDDKNIQNFAYKEIIDYPFILGLAYASHYVYRIEQDKETKDNEKNNYSLDTIKEKTGFEYVPGSERISKKHNVFVHSVAFVNHIRKVIVIAFKGTSNYTDKEIDIKLGIANYYPTVVFTDAISESLKNYKKTIKYIYNDKSKTGYNLNLIKTYDIVLTGHSLGAIYASLVALNNGLPARVFSSPATYFTTKSSSYKNFYSHFPFYDIINFVRNGDPIANYTGRHVENRIFFPQSKQNGILSSHSLIRFINEIFEFEVAPEYFDILPTYTKSNKPSESYHGLQKLLLLQGNTDPKLIDNQLMKDLNQYPYAMPHFQ